MKVKSYCSPAIPQKFYTPLRNWIIDLIKKNNVKWEEAEIPARLALALSTSYYQPELTEERLLAFLKPLGANNLELLEFKHMMNEVKNKIQEKKANASLSSLSKES